MRRPRGDEPGVMDFAAREIPRLAGKSARLRDDALGDACSCSLHSAEILQGRNDLPRPLRNFVVAERVIG